MSLWLIQSRLLNFRFACGANPQLLASVKVDVFAAFAHDSGRADARANRCADCRAGAATEDCSDDSADSGRRANFSDVALWLNLYPSRRLPDLLCRRPGSCPLAALR